MANDILDRFMTLPIGTQILCIMLFSAIVSAVVVNLVVHRREIACWMGLHRFKTELSEYVSFNYRNVYCKCQRCGKIERRYVKADCVYPMKTADKFETEEYKKRNWLK